MGQEDWAAKAAIAELITRYAVLNDAGDWTSVAALYTADGRMNRPTAPEQVIEGRDAILQSFLARPRRSTRHVIANVLVTLDDADHARATSQILLFVGQASQDGGPLPILAAGTTPLIGTYEDRLLRTAEGWRFRERLGRLDFRNAS